MDDASGEAPTMPRASTAPSTIATIWSKAERRPKVRIPDRRTSASATKNIASARAAICKGVSCSPVPKIDVSLSMTTTDGDRDASATPMRDVRGSTGARRGRAPQVYGVATGRVGQRFSIHAATSEACERGLVRSVTSPLVS